MTLYNINVRLAGISVPDVVREIITRNRSVYDCMKMDVINFTALAVKIQPDVERQLGGSVNLNTNKSDPVAGRNTALAFSLGAQIGAPRATG